MLFPTVRFALFFAVVLPLSWLLTPWRHRWNAFILAASYLFYAAWDWRFVLLLAGSTVLNQVVAEGIARTEDDKGRKAWLLGGVATNLAALAWFKYVGFFASSTNGLLNTVGLDVRLPLAKVVLPVGISFFTFQALSYVIDVYRRRTQTVPLVEFAVYLSFFPHLVAGPIVRASEFLPQLRARRDPHKVDAGLAFWLIATGLFKKVVVSSYLATTIVDPVFGQPSQHLALDTLIGIYAYAIQIYADFSGYTDIAIGLALLLGFRFPQNFDAPYTSVSLQDFWRRWHMTLSRWLRDYLYIPLGGNRNGRMAGYRNLMLTMVLGGLWHGAAWTFLVWGLIHGVGLAVERWLADRGEDRAAQALEKHTADEVVGPLEPGFLEAEALATEHGPVAVATPATGPTPNPWAVWGRRFLTFQIVCLAWVFFRAPTMADAFAVLSRLLHPGLEGGWNWVLVATIATFIATQYVPRDVVGRAQAVFSRWKVWMQVLALTACMVVIDVLGPVGVAPFIYFQF